MINCFYDHPDLNALPFRKEYNFRPGGMLPFPGQQHARKSYALIAKLIKFFSPASILSLSEVGKAMIHAVQRDDVKSILEIKDIKALSK